MGCSLRKGGVYQRKHVSARPCQLAAQQHTSHEAVDHLFMRLLRADLRYVRWFGSKIYRPRSETCISSQLLMVRAAAASAADDGARHASHTPAARACDGPRSSLPGRAAPHARC